MDPRLRGDDASRELIIRKRYDATPPAPFGPMPHALTAPTILVFDSGLGGLTVYREVAQARPDARLVYAADDAVFPYGRLHDGELVARVRAGMKIGQKRDSQRARPPWPARDRELEAANHMRLRSAQPLEGALAAQLVVERRPREGAQQPHAQSAGNSVRHASHTVSG